MQVKITLDKSGPKIYTILWPNTQLDFLLADRDSVINYDKEAVYILMDKFRRCFYIGETGATKSGGISNRFRTHKWEKGFWDCALVVRDQHGDFAQDSIRAWFEWKLNDIAKLANTSVVLSSASLGYLLALLGDKGNKSCRPCGKNSEWRKPLEDVGVRFDKDGFVADWKHAKNPL